jgi:hypothetical protein
VAAHKRAAAALKAKRAHLRPGSIVTLDNAVSFRDGTKAAVFRLRFVRGRTPVFEPVDRPGFLCRLSRASLAAAAVAPPEGAAPVAPAGG